MRLNNRDSAALELVRKRPDISGRFLRDAMERQGFKLAPHVFYTMMHALEQQGLVVSREESLTIAGQKVKQLRYNPTLKGAS